MNFLIKLLVGGIALLNATTWTANASFEQGLKDKYNEYQNSVQQEEAARAEDKRLKASGKKGVRASDLADLEATTVEDLARLKKSCNTTCLRLACLNSSLATTCAMHCPYQAHCMSAHGVETEVQWKKGLRKASITLDKNGIPVLPSESGSKKSSDQTRSSKKSNKIENEFTTSKNIEVPGVQSGDSCVCDLTGMSVASEAPSTPMTSEIQEAESTLSSQKVAASVAPQPVAVAAPQPEPTPPPAPAAAPMNACELAAKRLGYPTAADAQADGAC